MREVLEETGIHGSIVASLGTIDFWFMADDRRIHKTVHHYVLEAHDDQLSDADTLLMLGRTEFARCLTENASMSLVVMRGLVKRQRHADRKIESLALLDVYGRVAHALLDFAVADAQGQLLIKEKISRQDLAKMVGASREMVSRVMKDLEERGFIEALPNGATLLKDRLNALG